jgi:CRP-like cAMP-binding protein
MFGENQYIYLEGDEVSSICFVVSGNASFVLPSFENARYIDINVGSVFGIIDIIGSA